MHVQMRICFSYNPLDVIHDSTVCNHSRAPVVLQMRFGRLMFCGCEQQYSSKGHTYLTNTNTKTIILRAMNIAYEIIAYSYR